MHLSNPLASLTRPVITHTFSTGSSPLSVLRSTGFAASVLAATLALVSARVAHAAAHAPCVSTFAWLNTGYDHHQGGTLPIGSIDPRWIVVSDPIASTIEPRPAAVITKNAAWQDAQSVSQWISGYPTAVQNQNGAYIFETVFCLKPGIDLSSHGADLEIAMRADDACSAYLNGSSTPFHTGEAFGSATVTTSTYSLGSIGAVVGQNTLRIRVDNLFSVAMGLNVRARVLGSPINTVESALTCSHYGALQGFKFNDLNANGLLDSGESRLSGWQIDLSGPNGVNLTTTTDSEGFYNFIGLPAGTPSVPTVYTVTETLQFGWVQTYPLSGSHVLTFNGVQGFNGLAFGGKLVGPCAANQVVLNSGYDHLTNGTLAIGSIDPRWTVVSDPFVNTLEPRAATVIAKHPAWVSPDAGSQWLSGYPTSIQLQNGAYIFETVFCLSAGFNSAPNAAYLRLGMRADDQCSAYLNGSATPFHIGQGFGTSVLTMTDYNLANLGAVVGQNTLRIQVDNTGSEAMGLDLVATVFAPSHTAERPLCCSNYGALQGQQFCDSNSNGVRDGGEPALAGWQINLSGSNGLALTAVTDAEGLYNFLGLEPATYTLTETQQTGWTQTAPVSGTHVVTLTGIQGFNRLDFGNWSSSCPALPPPTGTYCTPGISTYGCTATMSVSEQPSASLDYPCEITVSNVEGQKYGILFFGIDNTGFTPLQWAIGSTSFMCVKGPTQRTPAQISSGSTGMCDGSLSLDWNAYISANPTTLGAPFAAGDKLYFQAWYRDPPAPKTTNLSNALELTMQP